MRKYPILAAAAVVAFAVAATRFLPSAPLSTNASDFFGGFGSGLVIATVMSWIAERGR